MSVAVEGAEFLRMWRNSHRSILYPVYSHQFRPKETELHP